MILILKIVVYDYNFCKYSITGVKPFFIFKSTDPLFVSNSTYIVYTLDFNEIVSFMTEYISKWENEFIARNNTEIINVGDGFFISNPYRTTSKYSNGNYESSFENEIYRYSR